MVNSNAVANFKELPNAAAIEGALIQGDLSKLTTEQRTQYYMKVCETLGLNPFTQPFAYIVLNGKLQLYPLRGCTDQLRRIYGVSVTEMAEKLQDGVYIVTVKVSTPDGRTDMSKGAVTVGNLKGDALANALMKTETKAKRRATLSICGLGMLDESEVETVPNARTMPAPTIAPPQTSQGAAIPYNPQTGEVIEATAEPSPSGPRVIEGKKWTGWAINYREAIERCATLEEANQFAELNRGLLDQLKQDAPPLAARLEAVVAIARKALVPAPTTAPADMPDRQELATEPVDDYSECVNVMAG